MFVSPDEKDTFRNLLAHAPEPSFISPPKKNMNYVHVDILSCNHKRENICKEVSMLLFLLYHIWNYKGINIVTQTHTPAKPTQDGCVDRTDRTNCIIRTGKPDTAPIPKPTAKRKVKSVPVNPQPKATPTDTPKATVEPGSPIAYISPNAT
jgi:hypothetical protein